MSYNKEFTSQAIPSLFDGTTNSKRSTFHEKCDIFRNVLFLAPPTSTAISLDGYQGTTNWKWPQLSRVELEHACTAKIKGKTPGPDLITQEIIVRAYKAIPDTFFNIYSVLID